MPSTILVVDDNDDNVELVDYLLTAHGYTTFVATTGHEGLRLAIQHRPDLILLDIRMPERDGIELAEAIRKVPELEDVRMVAVTASVMRGERQRVIAAGFDGFIGKPIDPASFVGEVEGYLDRKAVRQG